MADGEGLYLLVTAGGSRLWRLAYRFQKKQKTLAIGVYPTVTLADAREKRLAARRLLAAGFDPSAAKRQAVAAADQDNFQTIALEWWEVQAGTWKPAHAARVLARLKADVFPKIGMKNIRSIDGPDVLDVVRAVEARGALDVSKRLWQSVGAVFRFAIASGRARHDPSADIRDALKPNPRVEHFAALKAKDIPTFYRRLDAFEGMEGRRVGVELVLHTFVRTNEIQFARPEEFEDLDGKNPLWRIPAERMKKGREHLVPLTPHAVGLVRRLLALRGVSEWLMPGTRRTDEPMGNNSLLDVIYAMGYRGVLTVHGLRGTASTILNEQEFNSDWIERQLAHVEDNKIRGAYNSAQWLPQRRAMMEWWSAYLLRQRDLADLLG